MTIIGYVIASIDHGRRFPPVPSDNESSLFTNFMIFLF